MFQPKKTSYCPNMSLAFSSLCPLFPLPGKSFSLPCRAKSFPASYKIFSNSLSPDVPLHSHLSCFELIASSVLPVLFYLPILKQRPRKHVFLILVFLVLRTVPGTTLISNKCVERMNVYYRKEGTKSQLGIFRNNVFPSLTEIDFAVECLLFNGI